jgi:hypothetical protein
MQFLNRLMGVDSMVSRSRREDRAPRRRAAQFSLETLEDRDLKSDIPGVTMQYGVIGITATQGSNNAASVAIDPSNQMVKVTLNGNSVEYNQSDVYTVNFAGSQGGSDTFTNDTSLTEMAWGYGGSNQFQGGSSWNLVYLYGDSNTYDARGGASYVFAYNGPNDKIPAYNNVQVFASNYNPSWFW